MSSLWEEVQQQIVLVVMLVLPAAGGAIVAWFKAKQRRWDQEAAVKQAVREVEDSASSALFPPSGPEKHQAALHKLKSTAPGLKSPRASQMIEAVLPQVREESERPPPLPRDRQ